MENKIDYTIEKLNTLISIAEDGKQGYENASKDIDNEILKNSFIVFSKERAEYATKLRKFAYLLAGETQTSKGSSAGLLHRVWIDVKSVFSGGDTNAVLNACITGEEAAVTEYTNFLNDTVIPSNYKATINFQLHGIKQALSNLKSFLT